VHVPFSSIVPLVSPNDLVIGGWDINDMNIADACERAGVFQIDLQDKLRPYLQV
jgi:myo-inositol-1-phosphate synthase